MVLPLPFLPSQLQGKNTNLVLICIQTVGAIRSANSTMIAARITAVIVVFDSRAQIHAWGGSLLKMNACVRPFFIVVCSFFHQDAEVKVLVVGATRNAKKMATAAQTTPFV